MLLVAAYLVIMTVLAVSHLEDTDDFTWAQVSLDGVSWTCEWAYSIYGLNWYNTL